jgi:hypothetical protein
LHITLEPGITKEYDLVAGSHGLGSELFFDSKGTLCEIVLELKPFDVVDVAPMYLLKPVSNLLKSRAKSGHLTIKTNSFAPINPDAVWLLRPFGTAIFSFDGVIIEPAEKFTEQLETMEVIKVGQGIIIALDREQRLICNFNLFS